VPSGSRINFTNNHEEVADRGYYLNVVGRENLVDFCREQLRPDNIIYRTITGRRLLFLLRDFLHLAMNSSCGWPGPLQCQSLNDLLRFYPHATPVSISAPFVDQTNQTMASIATDPASSRVIGNILLMSSSL
jgi:hypothetical protein